MYWPPNCNNRQNPHHSFCLPNMIYVANIVVIFSNLNNIKRNDSINFVNTIFNTNFQQYKNSLFYRLMIYITVKNLI